MAVFTPEVSLVGGVERPVLSHVCDLELLPALSAHSLYAGEKKPFEGLTWGGHRRGTPRDLRAERRYVTRCVGRDARALLRTPS